MALPNEPLTRAEQYLNRTATGGGTIPDEPLTGVEMYLSKIATGNGNTPDVPLTRIEQYLAKIAGQDVKIPDVPLTRVEQYLAKIAGQDVKIPDVPLTRVEQYLDYIAENGSGGGGGGDLPPYSQDGLVLWLDGIFNTMNGHDDSATVWEDLSGNGHGYIYSSGNEIGNKYLRANGSGGRLQTGFSSEELALIRSEDATFEIVISPTDLSQNTCIIPHGDTRSSVTLYSGSILFGAKNAYLSLGLLSGVHSYNSKSLVDGSTAQNTAKKDTWPNSYSDCLFMYADNDTRYMFKGDVYAIRVYSRQLSDAEIAAHWSLDRSRFGIEV